MGGPGTWSPQIALLGLRILILVANTANATFPIHICRFANATQSKRKTKIKIRKIKNLIELQLTPPSDPRQGFAIPPLPEPEGSTLRAHLKQVGKSQPEFQVKTHTNFSLYLLYGASWIVQYFVFCFGIHSSLRDNVFSAVQSGV